MLMVMPIRIQKILELLKAVRLNPKHIFHSWYHSVMDKTKRNYVIDKFGLKKGLPVIDLLHLFPKFEETIHRFQNMLIDHLIGKPKVPQGDTPDCRNCHPALDPGSRRSATSLDSGSMSSAIRAEEKPALNSIQGPK